jgi:nicotinate dehydrogenase subunit A
MLHGFRATPWSFDETLCGFSGIPVQNMTFWYNLFVYVQVFHVLGTAKERTPPVTRIPLEFTLNGQSVTCEADGSALDVLRDWYGLNGPKYGCGMGQCGACSILVDGQVARACVLRAARLQGRKVVTLEGLAGPEGLHPVQQAFVDKQGAQCGYCLNGMVMTAVALLEADPKVTRDGIRQALRDNLCRCGTHQEIMDAVEQAARVMMTKAEKMA